MASDIETIVDRIVNYVQANGKSNTQKIGASLGVPAEQVERLGILLEQSGLMSVQYSLTGVFLLPMEEAEKQKDKTTENGVVPKFDFTKLAKEATVTESIAAFMEKDITRRINAAEKMLEELEKKQDFTKEDVALLEKELNIVLQQAAMFEEEVRKMQEKNRELAKLVEGFSKRLSTLKTVSGLEPKKQKLLDKIMAMIMRLIAFFKKPAQKPFSVDQKKDAEKEVMTVTVAQSSVNKLASNETTVPDAPKSKADKKKELLDRLEKLKAKKKSK